MSYIGINEDSLKLADIRHKLNAIFLLNEDYCDNKTFLSIFDYIKSFSNDLLKIQEATNKKIVILSTKDNNYSNFSPEVFKNPVDIKSENNKITLTLHDYTFTLENDVICVLSNTLDNLKILQFNKKNNESYLVTNTELLKIDHSLINYEDVSNIFTVVKNHKELISTMYSQSNQILIKAQINPEDAPIFNNITSLTNELKFQNHNLISSIKRKPLEEGDLLEVRLRDSYIKRIIVENDKISLVDLTGTTLNSLKDRIPQARLKSLIIPLKKNPTTENIEAIQKEILFCLELDLLNADMSKLKLTPIKEVLSTINEVSKTNGKLLNLDSNIQKSMNSILKSVDEGTKPIKQEISGLSVIKDFLISDVKENRNINLDNNEIENVWNTLESLIKLSQLKNKKTNKIKNK